MRGGWTWTAVAVSARKLALHILVLAFPAMLTSVAPLPAQGELTVPRATLVSLEVADAPIAAVVGIIRDQSGAIIVVAPDATGTITIVLDRVPWRIALDLVTRQAGCVVIQEGNGALRVEQPPKVTFDFAGADAKTVIDSIARVSGASIVTGSEVDGTVYLRINDVPWTAALDTVARTLGLVVLKEDWGIYRVMHPSKLEDQLTTHVFPIKYLRPDPPYIPQIRSEYAKPSPSAALVEQQEFSLIGALRNALSPKGSLEYHARNNIIVVKDIEPVIDEIGAILEEIDVQPAQVFIDVKFVTTSNTDSLSYGVDPGTKGFTASLTGGAIPSRLPFNVGGGGWNNAIIASADAQTPGLSPAATSAAITYGTLSFSDATFTLNLLKNDSKSRIVQSPKLLVLDNAEATIFVGKTVRYAETEASSNQSGGLQYAIREAKASPVQTGFQLYLVPHIVPGTDKIIMQVIPEAEQLVGTSTTVPGFQVFTSGAGTPNEVSIALPQVASQTLVSTLILKSGYTAVIGGLISESETDTVNKIPILGDIPILGFFFKSTRRSKVQESLLIFITPRILKDPDMAGQLLAEEDLRRQKAIESELESIYGPVVKKDCESCGAKDCDADHDCESEEIEDHEEIEEIEEESSDEPVPEPAGSDVPTSGG